MKTKPRHIIFTLCLVATIAACMYKGFPRFWERCYNQVAYSFFGKTINPYVVKGRANELFLKPNIDDISGKTLLDHYGSIENAKAEAHLKDNPRSIASTPSGATPIGPNGFRLAPLSYGLYGCVLLSSPQMGQKLLLPLIIEPHL